MSHIINDDRKIVVYAFFVATRRHEMVVVLTTEILCTEHNFIGGREIVLHNERTAAYQNMYNFYQEGTTTIGSKMRRGGVTVNSGIDEE